MILFDTLDLGFRSKRDTIFSGLVVMINGCGPLLWLFDDSWLWSSFLSSGIVYTSNVAIMRIFGCCPAVLETVEGMVVSSKTIFTASSFDI